MEIKINFKENKFVAAKFGKVNGIKGWLSVNIYLTASSEIDKFSKFYINNKKTNLLFKKKGKKVVCKIEGVNDIDTAKQYVGSEIFVDKKELPKLCALSVALRVLRVLGALRIFQLYSFKFK